MTSLASLGRRRWLHVALTFLVVLAALVVIPPHRGADAAHITIDGDRSDWDGLPATVDLCERVDGNGATNDDIFKQGTKFEDIVDVGDVSSFLVNQKAPKKGDLCLAQSQLEDVGGDLILYVAWERSDTDGEVSVYIPFGDGDGVLEADEFVLRYDYDSSSSSISVFVIDSSGTSTPVNGGNVQADVTPNLLFAETSINLSASGILPDTCSAVVAPYLVTETGQDNANPTLKDYVNIDDIVINTCGTLIVEKTVVGDGATFGFDYRDVAEPIQGQPVPFELSPGSDGTDSITFSDIEPDIYQISELSGPDDYELTDLSCVGSDQAPVVTGPIVVVSVPANTTVTCTFINSQLPKLTLQKIVSNDDGGDFTVTDFGVGTNAFDAIFGPGSENPTDVFTYTSQTASVQPGTYTLSETTDPGYSASDWLCGGQPSGDPTQGSVTLAYGDDVTCVVVNDDNAPVLILEKQVKTDDGGTAVAGDFTLDASGANGDNFSGQPSNVVTPDSGFSSAAQLDPREVEAGVAYTLDESAGPAGYAEGAWSCDGGTFDSQNDTITLDLAASVTCTVTNDDIAPTLTLLKDLQGVPLGSPVTDTDFVLEASGPTTIFGVEGDASITQAPVPVGTYNLAESPLVSGYDGLDWLCTGADGFSSNGDGTGSVNLTEGQNATCTVTNQAQTPQLRLIKDVTNNFDGPLGAGDFTLTLDGSPITVSQGDYFDVMAWTDYLIGEEAEDGYVQTDIQCVDDAQGAIDFTDNGDGTGTVNLVEGQSATCTVSNEDLPASLTLVKAIVNDNGGVAGIDDFGIITSANGEGAIAWTEAPDGTFTSEEFVDLSAGTYTFSEQDVDGYSEGTWSCDGSPAGAFDAGSVDLANGDDVTCTITNDDDPAQLTIEKVVVNDDGGSATVGDFNITTDAGALSFGAAVENPTDTFTYTAATLTVDAGTYSLAEDDVDGYSEGTWSCSEGLVGGSFDAGSVDLANGDDVTCTITNDDDPAQLTIEKVVVNDDGGSATVGDFNITTDAGALSFGAAVEDPTDTFTYTADTLTVDAGTYSLAEDDVDGYSEGTWSCSEGLVGGSFGGGSVALANGADVTCTITNDDVAANLTLVKVVDGAGSPDEWNLAADGPTPISGDGGVSNDVAAGTYTLSESGGPDGYEASDWVCEGDGTQSGDEITLANGDSATCTITNSELPTVTVNKVTNPESTTEFDFTLTPGDTQSVPGDGSAPYTWEDLQPGEYSLVEALPEGWAYEGVQCTLTPTGAFDYTEVELGASFSLGYGDHVTCVFGNNELGSVTVVKATDIDTEDTFDFDFDGTQFSLGDGDSETFDLLPAGEYDLAELLGDPNWILDDVSCDADIATVNADDTVSVDVDWGDDVTCTFTNVTNVADLAVTKTDNDTEVVLNFENPTGQIDYDITVTNNGPAVATGVTFVDTLPVTTDFVSATPSQGSCAEAGGVVTCDLGTMAVGATVTIAISVATEELGSLTDPLVDNLVEVSGDQEDSDPSNNTDDEQTPILEVESLADVAISKTDGGAEVVLTEGEPDGEIAYVVTVENLLGVAATGVVVTDTLPDTVTFKSAVPDKGTCSLAGQVLTCVIGDLAGFETVDIAITVGTESFDSLTVPNVVNVAEVEINEEEASLDNNRAEETTPISEVRDELPETGFDSGPLAVVGALLLGLGALLLATTRRRDQGETA